MLVGVENVFVDAGGLWVHLHWLDRNVWVRLCCKHCIGTERMRESFDPFGIYDWKCMRMKQWGLMARYSL